MRLFVSHFARSTCTVACLAAIVGTSALLTGCGSSGHTVALSRQVIASEGYLNRTYLSDTFSAEGLNGGMLMTIFEGDTATASLLLSTPLTSTAPPAPPLTPGTVELGGTFSRETGAFTLSGSYVVDNTRVPVTVTGTLPATPSYSGGTIATTINGTTYHSTFIDTPVASPGGTLSSITTATSVVSGKSVKP